MYLCFYCKLVPCFGEDNVELHDKDTDSFVFSFTPKNVYSMIWNNSKKI